MTYRSHLPFIFYLETKKPSSPCFKQKDESLNFRVTTLIRCYFTITTLNSTWIEFFKNSSVYRCALTGTPVVSLPWLTYSALRPSSISCSLPIFSRQGSLQTSMTCTLLFKALSMIVLIIAVVKLRVNILPKAFYYFLKVLVLYFFKFFWIDLFETQDPCIHFIFIIQDVDIFIDFFIHRRNGP